MCNKVWSLLYMLRFDFSACLYNWLLTQVTSYAIPALPVVMKDIVGPALSWWNHHFSLTKYVTPRSLVNRYQRFGTTCYLHLQVSGTEKSVNFQEYRYLLKHGRENLKSHGPWVWISLETWYMSVCVVLRRQWRLEGLIPVQGVLQIL